MMMNDVDNDKAKKIIITRLNNLLKAQGTYVKNDELMTVRDKVTQMDVLINLMKFLDNYDENIKILNQHIYNNRWQRYERGDE